MRGRVHAISTLKGLVADLRVIRSGTVLSPTFKLKKKPEPEYVLPFASSVSIRVVQKQSCS